MACLTSRAAWPVTSIPPRTCNKPEKAKSPYPLSNVKYTKYGGTAGAELTYADFKPAYTYTVTAAEDVPAVVKAGAGYGKLGYASAPVIVDNGGIVLTQ